MRLEHWWYTIPLRLRSMFRRARVEEELQEELHFHLEQRIARETAAGKTPQEARYAARRAMDGMEQRKEECRDVRRVNTISNLVQDLSYAWRALRRNPAFTGVAVLTLALGIGANTAIFSVVNAALLRPLPYPRPEQLILLFELFGHRPNVVSFANFMDWERESHSFLAMAAGRQASFNLGGNPGGTGSFQPERIQGAVFSWQLFKTLGVQPDIGRAFAARDDRLGASRVAVISYGLWQRRFGGSSDILQRQIRLDGVDCAIIGVMPRTFAYPTRGTDVWVPIVPLFGPDLTTNRAWHHLYVVARVRDGVPIGQATAEVNGIQQRLLAANPGELLGQGATGLPLRDITTQQSRTSLLVLLGAVGCLLLIACVNISNLLLARGSQRWREFSIRTSLGASPSRLMQQLLTESLLLALIGAVAGLALAYGLTSALGPHAPSLINADDIDTSAPVRIDGWVLMFTAVLSLLAGVGAGLLPARRSMGRGRSIGLGEGLKDGGRTATAGLAQQRLRTGLVSAEVALSLMLLIAAGLMIRSFAELQKVHTGVRAGNLLTAGISLPDSRYGSRASVARFDHVLLERLRTLPGVRDAGLVNCLPVDGYCGDNSFSIEGRPLPPGHFNMALERSASPGYFRVAGIPLLAGRTFTERDGRGYDDQHPHPSAVIISESMAKKYWNGENALGKRIFFGDGKSPRYEVIGIVGDVLISLDGHPQPAMYRPEFEGGNTDFYAVLEIAGDPSALASSVRRVIGAIDPDIPAYKIRAMTEVVGNSAAHQAFTALLLGSFAALALLLSAVGLYGVLSYLTTRRTAEMGVRIALGASRGKVCRLVLAQGLRPTCLGLIVGLAGAAALTRTLKSVLFGVAATDWITFASAAALLMLVAVVACVIPAWRAACIDPVRALRNE
jgi:predicted permease